MKYFKNPTTNEIYAYEADGSQDAFIKEGLVAITSEEAAAIREQQAQADEAALPYTLKRVNEYPDFREYLDGIVKGDQAQIAAYIAACQAVKTKYPKP